MAELAKPKLIQPPKGEILLAYVHVLHIEVDQYLSNKESFFPKNLVFLMMAFLVVSRWKK